MKTREVIIDAVIATTIVSRKILVYLKRGLGIDR